MDDRQTYIGILETAAGLLDRKDRTDIGKMIDRRLFHNAAAALMETGVPVRVSDDGIFLTIDLGGRSYTLRASAAEAILRGDYERALSTCRYMAALASAEPGTEQEEQAGDEAFPGTGEKEGPARGARFRVLAGGTEEKETGRPRFESRASGKENNVIIPEDPGTGGVPADIPQPKIRFRRAGEDPDTAGEELPGSMAGPADTVQKNIRVQNIRTGRTYGYTFFITGTDRPGSGFDRVNVRVSDPVSGRTLISSETGMEVKIAVDGILFRVVGIHKDGLFLPGIMLTGKSAAECIMEIHE